MNKTFMMAGICTFFLFSALAEASVEAVIGSVPISKNPNMAVPIPSSQDSEILISREQYVISYNKIRRAPNWVAWRLEAGNIGNVPRRSIFSKDPDLEKYLAQSGHQYSVVDTSEYVDSCFDRGHQVPSKDRTDTVADNEETFLTSNIIPQTAYLNRVIWEHLEQYTRDLVQHHDKKAYVIAGPVYDEDFGSIGPNKDIPVPSKNFKIVIILDKNQTPKDINEHTQVIVAMMPNVYKDGTKPTDAKHCQQAADDFNITATFGNPNDWERYETTLSNVEKASGIHFH